MTRVAAAQVAPVVGDLDGNVLRAEQALEDAVAAGAGLVVLPELVTSGYVFADADEARALAVTPTHPVFAEWARAAARLGDGTGASGVVVGGFAELGDDGHVYNSSAVVTADGVLGVYRKVHLWDREKLVFTPGSDRPLVVDTPQGRIGTMVCFDMEFPEWTRLAALDGAELLAVPTNWPLGGAAAAERAPHEYVSEVRVAIAAAITNRMAIACADRTGTERGVDWNEGTSIIAPNGTVLAAVGSGSGIAVADVDLAATRDKALSGLVDLLGDRRPDLYGPLADR